MTTRKYEVALTLAVAIVCVACGYVMGRASATGDTATQTRLANTYAQAKSNLAAATDIAEHAQRSAARVRISAQRTVAAADSQAARTDSLLADTAATASALRQELSAQLRISDSLTATVRLLDQAVDSLSVLFAVERQASKLALASANSALLAYKQPAQGQCRIGRLLPCPTRPQAVVLGVLTGILLTR